MADSLIVASDAVGVASTANTTQFWNHSGAIFASTTETFQQIINRSAGTYKNLMVLLTANGLSASKNVTITFRKGAANGNQTTGAIAGGTTGFFEDLSHTDAVVAADKTNITSVVTGTTGTFTINVLSFLFAATTNTVTRLAASNSGSKAWTGTGSFQCIQGQMATSSNETNLQTLQKQAGTFQNLAANVSANAKTSNENFTSRLNTAAGAMSAPITLGTTGFFEDTSHSDAVAVGNHWDTDVATGGDTTNALTIATDEVDFSSTANIFIVQAGEGAGVTTTASTTQFNPIGGRANMTTTETNIQDIVRDVFTFQDLNIFVFTAATVQNTLTFRDNAGNGNQTVPLTASTTGDFTDITHSDLIASGDKIDTTIITGTSTTSYTHITVWGSTVTSINFLQWALPTYQWIET